MSNFSSNSAPDLVLRNHEERAALAAWQRYVASGVVVPHADKTIARAFGVDIVRFWEIVDAWHEGAVVK